MAMVNLKQQYRIPCGADDHFPRDTLYKGRFERRADSNNSKHCNKRKMAEIVVALHEEGFHESFKFDAMPVEYVVWGLENVALLKDGKDFVADAVRINLCVSRGQYSDKIESSTARYVAWTLPCGLSVTYSSQLREGNC